MPTPDSAAHSLLRIADLRVDPALDEICKDGRTIKLEPKAMRLLLCLAERAGQVVSVDELLDAVWKEVVVSQDSVYAAVAALRRTLGDDPKNPKYIANRAIALATARGAFALGFISVSRRGLSRRASATQAPDQPGGV